MNKVSNLRLRRWLEHRIVEWVMAALAWLLEKAVLQSMRRGGTKP